MKAQEFKDVANYLRSLNNVEFQEGKERTAISRFYYYIFLRLRNEIIFNLDTRDVIKKLLSSSKAHSLVRRYIKEVARASRSLVGMYYSHIRDISDIEGFLYQLHDKRKIADYDIDYAISSEELETVIQLVQEIEQRLSVFESTLRALNNERRLPEIKRLTKDRDS
ncbi:hypothetical protein [Thermococcus sp. 2319x1]|uniref:hypothetical protein n=1 Tax=Thermococcus sp. 2319x1 TaxID=1674923 RepID=UPI001581C05E|nr:hypothetical protein [Thermococcus sp. 2319x1]